MVVSSNSSDSLLNICRTLLPAPTVEAALVVMGTINLPKDEQRPLDTACLVKLWLDETPRVAVIELNDPARANVLSSRMTDDLAAAMTRLSTLPASAVLLQGKGPHFCAGANPHQRYEPSTPLATLAAQVRQTRSNPSKSAAES